MAAASNLKAGKQEAGNADAAYAGILVADNEEDKSRGLSSSTLKLSSRSLAPFDVEPGLCCKCKLLGTGECVPNEISESEVSEGVGDGAPSGRRLLKPEF